MRGRSKRIVGSSSFVTISGRRYVAAEQSVEARLVQVFDTERAEFYRATKWMILDPVTVHLQGGPASGYSQEMAFPPDWWELDDGQYLPLFAEPTTYIWIAARHVGGHNG